MSSLYTQSAEHSGNPNLPSALPTAAEQAAWALFDPYKATKGALWIDASYYASPVLPSGRTDDQFAPSSTYMLASKCGYRIFTPGFSGSGHPWRATNDDITNRPVHVFGMGGGATNVLTNSMNGNLGCASIVDASNVEQNQVPLMTAGTGYSFAAKFRCPVATTGAAWGATMNGFPGGVILGNNEDGPNEAYFGLRQGAGTGQFEVRHLDTTQVITTSGADLRDGTWHTVIVTYNPTTQKVQLWLDNATNPILSVNVTTDIAGGQGAIPRIGCYGATAANDRFSGGLAFVGYLPTPALEDPASRALITALMAEK